MRIAVQNIFDEAIRNRTARASQLWRALDAYLAVAGGNDVEVNQHFLERSTNQVYNRYCEHRNEEYLVQALRRREQEGAAAAVVVCIADPGVQEARSILQIPVVGAGEAAIAAAQFLGKRFAIVVVRPEVVPMVERRLDFLHAYGRAIARPVRAIEHWSYDNLIDAFESSSDLLLDEFTRVARGCVADGADVIVSGCAYVGPLLTRRGVFKVPDSEVPIVDCTASAIQMAAMMARARRTMPESFRPSRAPHSPYSPPEYELQEPFTTAA